MPDEAYYWLWGQHPDLSYLDHPPLQAWTQWVATEAFGISRFSLRLPAVLSSIVIIAALIWWAKLLNPGLSGLGKLGAITAAFASPLFFSFTGMAFNDHVLLALLSLATISIFKLFQSHLKRQKPDLLPLYASALLIGLAGLTKYNAILFAAGLFVAILWTKPYRSLLKSPHTYLAALLCLACLTPVFLWNQGNQSASFQYNLDDRLTDAKTLSVYTKRVFGFLLPFLLSFSPFLIYELIRSTRNKPDPESNAFILRSFALPIFVTATIGCLVLARFTFVIFYWNIVAIIPVIPLVVMYFQSRWVFIGHLLWGSVLLGLLMINHTIFPLSAFSGKVDDETAIMFGWPEISQQVHQVQAENNADFLVTSDYRSGSILAFWTGDISVQVIASRFSQFSIWLDRNDHISQDAVILTSNWFPLTDVMRDHFEVVEFVRNIDVERLGRPVTQYQIYLGHTSK